MQPVQPSRLAYAQRTMIRMGEFMQPVEDIIRQRFLPALFGGGVQISDEERALYALPAREGGLGIDNPVLDSHIKFADSQRYTATMQDLIMASEPRLLVDVKKQKSIKASIKKEHRVNAKKGGITSTRDSGSRPSARFRPRAREGGVGSFLDTASRQVRFCIQVQRGVPGPPEDEIPQTTYELATNVLMRSRVLT